MKQIILLILVLVVFYFFMIRPQTKKQKKLKHFRENHQLWDKIESVILKEEVTWQTWAIILTSVSLILTFVSFPNANAKWIQYTKEYYGNWVVSEKMSYVSYMFGALTLPISLCYLSILLWIFYLRVRHDNKLLFHKRKLRIEVIRQSSCGHDFSIKLESLNDMLNDHVISKLEYEQSIKKLILEYDDKLEIENKNYDQIKREKLPQDQAFNEQSKIQNSFLFNKKMPVNKISKKILYVYSNANPRTIMFFGLIWILFHLFLLLTTELVFRYRIEWKSFWIFDDWDSYDSWCCGVHYDISEFTVYVIIPLLIFYGRKYIKGEKVLNFEFLSEKKTKEDYRINNLKKYKELFELGVISEDEFKTIKKKLLG